MTGADVRVHTLRRSDVVARLSFVAPDKPWYAFAVTGLVDKVKVEATGYGTTEDEALADLEHNVMAKPSDAKKPRLRAAGIGHVAIARDPNAAFNSTCIVEGCNRPIIRVYGVQARRSNFRHVKAS